MLMSSSWRRLRNEDLVVHLAKERKAAREEIQRLHAEKQLLELHHSRNVRDLLAHFRYALENEDLEDLDETLEQGLRDMNDSVARLEEWTRT